MLGSEQQSCLMLVILEFMDRWRKGEKFNLIMRLGHKVEMWKRIKPVNKIFVCDKFFLNILNRNIEFNFLNLN